MDARILVVDDLPMVREFAQRFLRYTPVDLLTAGNGLEALAVIRSEHPDLVYMDLRMPRMDGAECCRHIKTDKALGDLPVIMMINGTAGEEISAALSAGCNEVLSKPLDRREFLAKGRQFLPQIDRREPRISCEMLVSFAGEGAGGVGSSLDISPGGMYLIAEAGIAEQSELSLDFTLPGEEARKLSARGRVAWLNQSADGTVRNPHLPRGAGIEFTEVPELVKDCIRRFVAMRHR